MKNILIVTGGSGGHVVPSISLFEHLKKNFSVKMVSDLRGSKFINIMKFKYELIDVPNLFLNPYLLPINIIKYFFNIFKSINFIRKNKINILISTGGYMTFPFCVAAFILKKKIVLFEPNSFLGRSNRFALKFSTKIICYDQYLKNFPKKYNFKKIILNPILRKEIYNIKKNSINTKKEIKKILVIGGSQGASFFDNNITELIVEISKNQKLEVIQQLSNKDSLSILKEKYNKSNIKYNFFDFTDNSNEVYKDVDLAITRGGASTLAELSYLNIPYIAIPLPSAKDNHQFYNSNYYCEKNCCWIIDQEKFEINKISNLIYNIFNNHEDYRQKIYNLNKLTEKNTWSNINNHIIEVVNEN